MSSSQEGVADAAILDIKVESNLNGTDIVEFIEFHYSIPFVFLTSYIDDIRTR